MPARAHQSTINVTDAVTVGTEVAAVAPFRLDLTAMALQRRRHNRIDVWDGSVLRRVMPAASSGGVLPAPFLVEIRALDGQSAVRVDVTGAADAAALRLGGERAVTSLLGLDRDLSGFYAMAASDPRLAPLVGRLRGLKPPRYPGLFEGLMNAVPCQQVTLSLGLQLLERLARAYGPDLPYLTAFREAGPLALPSAADLVGADADAIGAMGFSRAKARTLIELATAVHGGDLDLAAVERLPSPDALKSLTALYGVGRWTAEYVLLRAAGRLDVYPDGDSGARNGLARFLGEPGKPSYEWVADQVAPWAPYAGFVYLHLLVDGLTRADTAGELHRLLPDAP